MTEPQILRPYHRQEAISAQEAAELAGKSVRTIRNWCLLHDLGRRVGGSWAVSKVALAMWLEGAREALNAYLAGDRASSLVREYFSRCQVPLPRQAEQPATRQDDDASVQSREARLSELKGCYRP